MNKPQILVVEDDTAVGNLITTTLETQNYLFHRAKTGAGALMDALSYRPDVILLDLGLPDMDGVTLIQKIRSWSNLPIIVISARSEDSDKVSALDAGADDYLTKPFEPKELLACIRALTRRQPELRQTDALKYGDLRLEKTSFTLSCGERSVRLSRKEFDMMEMLMLNQKLVITKEKLLLKVWGYESDAEDNNVEVYISFLRKKLDHLHSQVKIRTIRMVGYCLEAPEEA